ncbi:pyridoxal 5'-phosphate synthase glutaminase subunit PdxT [Bacillus fonticola]|uniref:pyridoxal 5'-phosphate synthase glutaminase subunit PdxT n=1 Tax=Bacillus fonticola TaxID=2728853 RepID=UPI0014760C26|nr:pyridoxal 5'-phosphate synthase glutaminase subunit PdxT [Bacillus fonticola]
MKIGVLGLQGAVREHVKAVEALGETAVVIKKREQLHEIDGLMLPGGESTTMRRLIDRYGFMEDLRALAEQKLPMFGTCAGCILLAKHIVDAPEPHIAAMDIKVERNSFGRQRESFEVDLPVAYLGEEDFPAVFIRAPHIVEAGENVEVLAKYDGRIVAAQQSHLLACSFHPELTDDHRMTRHFIEMVRQHAK